MKEKWGCLRCAHVCLHVVIAIMLKGVSCWCCLLQHMKEVVEMCLHKDPKMRPSAEKLLQHKFFKVRDIGLASALLRLVEVLAMAV